MTVHTAYEVYVLRNANWRVEAVFDEEILAIAAAKTVEVRSSRAPVVVIQEIHDVARNLLKSRSVYRTSGEAPLPPVTKLAFPAPASAARPFWYRATATAAVILFSLLFYKHQ